MIGGRPYTDRTTLIKGGYVLTLDPELGDLPLTDVLIDGDKIAAIGRNLTVSPNANDTPKSPMPTLGKAAANTALPQPSAPVSRVRGS